MALLVIWVLAACNGGAASSGQTIENPDGEPTYGGDFIFALGGKLDGDVLDPHKTANAQNIRVIRSIYDSLVVEKEDHSIEPWLAESWEISEDQKSYTFKLREDVTFHDGTPFNAEAVKYNFDRINDPDTNAYISKNEIGPYESSEVLEEFTIAIHFSQPFAPFLSNLSHTTLGIVSPTAVEEHGDRYVHNPVGTGPFVFTELIEGTEIHLEKNEEYDWAPPTANHEGPAYLDTVVIKMVPEEATRIGVLESKQVHAADIIPPQNLAALQANDQFQVFEKELIQNNYNLFLNSNKAPWDQKEIREAFRLAIDMEAAVNTNYLGTFETAYSPISPGTSGYQDFKGTWSYDAEKAADILEAEGWEVGADGIREKDGEKLKVEFIDTQGNREKRLDLITIIQQQLKEVGFDLEIVSLPAGTYRERADAGDYDLSASSQFSGEPDVLRVIFSTRGPRGENSVSKVKDEELDDWLDQAVIETDPERRLELYGDIQEKIISDVYSIPTYVFLYNIGAGQEVNDITFDYTGFPQFYDTWIDQP